MSKDFCTTEFSRAEYHVDWQAAPPPFDEDGLKHSIDFLPDIASDTKTLFNAVIKITSTFICPPSAAALLLADKKMRVQEMLQNDLVLRYAFEDFQLQQKQSIARYALDYDRSYFAADTGIHSKVVSFYAMEGEPVQDQLGDFPEYVLNTPREDRLDCSLLTKDVNLVHQAVLIPLLFGNKRGLLFLGFQPQIFGNGGYPRTKFDHAWYFVLMKPQIQRLLCK